METNTHHKTALVTGASEGIGRALAKKLAHEGYQITLVARNKKRLEELLVELPGTHELAIADLSTTEGVQKICRTLTQKHYHLLVNNAGFGLIGEFEQLSLEKNIEMLHLNIEALVALSHAFLVQAQRGDALVNVSSVLAFAPLPANGLYSATKAFVTSFSETLWHNQKKRGVYVMNLCPGITATEFHRRAGDSQRTPPAALMQTPEEVAEATLQALRRRRDPTIVSGYKNQFMAQIFKTLPRKSLLKILGSQV
ncbi:MAG: SDR family NAD(P)-dependent oxidoreductase [Bdellovibrionales bacterium]